MSDSQTSSIRESLNAAVEKVEASNEPAEAPNTATGGAEPRGASDLAGGTAADVGAGESANVGSAGSRVRGPDGKFAKAVAAEEAKASKTPAPVAAAPTETKAPPNATTATTPAPVAAVTTPTLKAPQSWKADVREKFAALPPEVQAEVMRRETEIAQTLQGASEPKKFHEAFKQATAPYEQQFAARGMNSLKAVTDLLPTALALHTGSPEQKAQTIAQAIQAFGIPIEVLARALDGQPAQTQQAQQVNPDQIAAQVQQRLMQQFQHQQQQAAQAQAVQEAEAFAASGQAEFLEDVKEDMAILFERGRVKTLPEAYELACRMNPEVFKVQQQREAAKAAQAQQAATQNARNASVSVRTTTAAPTPTVPKSRREALEEAAAKVGR